MGVVLCQVVTPTFDHVPSAAHTSQGNNTRAKWNVDLMKTNTKLNFVRLIPNFSKVWTV